MASLGFKGRPRLAEPKQVNSGAVDAAAPVSVLFGALPCGGGGGGAGELPSRWEEVQFAFPREKVLTAILSADNGVVGGVCRKGAEFDAKKVTSPEALY